MKNLLLAIQNELQESSTLSYIKDENIFIVELDGMIPSGSKFPLITLKDYGSDNDQQLLQKYYQKSRVSITIFNRVYEIGDSTKNKGILEIEEDIFDLLIDNKLDICYLYNAFPIIQESTKSIKLTEKDTIAYKRLIMEYSLFLRWN